MTKRRVRPERGGASASQPSVDLLRSRLRRLGVALVCAKLALVPVVFDPNADEPFTVVKALGSHALAYVLAGVIAGLFLQFGRSFYVHSPLHIPVGAFLVTNIAAAFLAVDSLLALYGAHERMLGLGTVADQVLLYFAVVLVIRTRWEAIAVAASVIAASMIVLAYEAVQLAGRDPLGWTVDSAIRPFSTIGQTTSLAEYLTVLAVGAATLGIIGRALPGSARLLLALYSALALAGAVVTQTRSMVFGLVAGIILVFALTWALHPDRRARVVSAVGAAGTSLALALVLLITPLGARLFSTVELSNVAESDAGPRLERAADGRAALYRISFDMVRDRPALGHGPDNFLASLPKYRSDNEPYEVQDLPNNSAHSWVAQVAVTSGLLGLAAFVGIAVVGMVLTLKSGFRPEAWAALAMMAAFLGAGLTTVNAVSTDQLFWMAAGVVAAVTSRRPALSGPADRGRVPPRTGHARHVGSQASATRSAMAFLSVGLGLVLAVATVQALDASHLAKASRVARLQGRDQQAVDFGLRATRADPARAQYWEALGLAYVSGDRIRDAASAFERASELAPYDVRYDGDLARAFAVLAQRGDSASAVQARSVAERAVRIDPNNPLANLTRAFVMQVTGNLPEALKSIERALALDRLNGSGVTSHPDMYVTAIQVLSALERRPDAIALARSAVARVPQPTPQVAIRIELSRALAANGQLGDALTEIDSALAIQPTHPGAQQLRAQILAAQGR